MNPSEGRSSITFPPRANYSLTLDLPRESGRSLILRRDMSKDGAGAGYEFIPGILRLQIEGIGDVGSVLRMNATSVWFEPDQSSTVPYGKPGKVTLISEDAVFGPFSAHFGIEALEDDLHAVARLRDVAFEDGRMLVAFMLEAARRDWARPVRPGVAVQTDIDDPVRIRAVLQSLKHRRASAVIKCEDGMVKAQLVGFEEDQGTLFWQFMERPGRASMERALSIEVAGYNCTYKMEFPRGTKLAYGLETPIPARVDYNRYRRYRRAPISDSTVARFNHPLWNEIPTIEGPLLDVSFGGVAFACDPLKHALYVGMRVDPIEIMRDAATSGSDEAKTILLRGTVRSLVALPDGTTTCGLSVEPKGAPHAEAWASFVMQALNQTTAPVGDRVEQLWQLYTDSGYFNLSGKDPTEFNSLAASFRDVVERTRAIPWLSYQSVWPSGSQIDAAASIIKVYDKTWMFHQLAKRRSRTGDGSARHVLRDTYLRAFEYIQSDPNCNWVLIYGEAHVRWMLRSHYAFASHFESTGAAICRPFRLMESECHLRADSPRQGAYRIGAAAPDERRIIVDVLANTLPRPYLEACDFVADRFEISTTKRAWSDIGLEREREVWVARYGYSPVAAAILEAGQTGTNLFRLLDSLRLVPLLPGGEKAFPALVEKAKAWFLARGKSSFVYLRESPDEAHVEATHMRDLGEGRIWIIRNDLIPDFLEMVCELTSDHAQPHPGRSEVAVPGPASVRGEFMLQPGSSEGEAPPMSVRGRSFGLGGRREMPSEPDDVQVPSSVLGAVPGPISVNG